LNNFTFPFGDYVRLPGGNEPNEPKQEQTQLQFHTSGNHGNHTAGSASSCDASHLPCTLTSSNLQL